ncbi:crotonase/enoyl-CoA hydratase family protein [Pelagimonas varians]|uniref:Putative enoyl-CoA hydratase echA8 n=1 Tax=Pelagimonas varians TaxID=696760 RepID=A0A238JQL4_9RHOB|nr:crotonase/enoyl-CoA hydratase family protein [Pelagimonas varians]PYG34775.1 enoyl-CoA hydratase/carnithine racemase [Pelagimonas varians]SMX32467.1 putative enoyl-CoA hydratase echA8 [Pelagimonas varians]
MTSSVLLKRDGHVAEVWLNRPEKHNAVDQSVFDGLARIGEEIRADKTIRAVILTGTGDNFCSGIDTGFFTGALNPAKFIEQITTFPEGEKANMFQKPGYVWQEVGVPVIAALQGATFGAGIQIALGADIRLAAPSTRMSVMEIKWGLIPDMSITQTLPRLVRMDVAKELLFTGRIVEAAECAEIGLVTRIVDNPLEAAREMAALIAAKNPDAISRSKTLLNESWHGDAAETLRLEAELQAQIIGQPNQMEAVFAQFQKRAPNFK